MCRTSFVFLLSFWIIFSAFFAIIAVGFVCVFFRGLVEAVGMSVDSLALKRFIRTEENRLDEGVTVEHVAMNYTGDDRPKTKFEIWLRSVQGLVFFEWRGKPCVKVMQYFEAHGHFPRNTPVSKKEIVRAPHF